MTKKIKKKVEKVKREFATKVEFDLVRQVLNEHWLPMIQLNSDKIEALDIASKYNALLGNKLIERVDKLEADAKRKEEEKKKTFCMACFLVDLSVADGFMYKIPEHACKKEETPKLKKCKDCNDGIHLEMDICSPCYFKKYPELEKAAKKDIVSNKNYGMCFCLGSYECMQHYAKRVVAERESNSHYRETKNCGCMTLSRDGIMYKQTLCQEHQIKIDICCGYPPAKAHEKPKVGEIWKDNLGYMNIVLHPISDKFGERYATLKFIQHKKLIKKDDIEVEKREKTQEELIEKIC